MCCMSPVCSSDLELDSSLIISGHPYKKTHQISITGSIWQTEELKSRKLKLIKSNLEIIWLKGASTVWSKGSEYF